MTLQAPQRSVFMHCFEPVHSFTPRQAPSDSSRCPRSKACPEPNYRGSPRTVQGRKGRAAAASGGATVQTARWNGPCPTAEGSDSAAGPPRVQAGIMASWTPFPTLPLALLVPMTAKPVPVSSWTGKESACTHSRSRSPVHQAVRFP